jgi:hypothetical protein
VLITSFLFFVHGISIAGQVTCFLFFAYGSIIAGQYSRSRNTTMVIAAYHAAVIYKEYWKIFLNG